MKYAIIMDSIGCIPEQEYLTRSIKLMPLAVRFDGVEYVDSYSEKALIPLHAAGRVGIKSDAATVTPSANDVRKYLIKHIAPSFDVAIVETVGKSFTPIFDTCKQISNSIAADAKATRLKLGITTPFRMSSSDSGVSVAGQGLIALYSDDLLRADMNLSNFFQVIEDFKTQVKTLFIVRDTVFARHRLKQKGNKTVSYPMAVLSKALQVSPISVTQNNKIEILDLKTRGFETAIEKVLGYCIDRVKDGLVAPLINISVAGDTSVVSNHNSYKILKQLCNDLDVKLYLGVMTLAATINVGPGAISVGIAPINQSNDI